MDRRHGRSLKTNLIMFRITHGIYCFLYRKGLLWQINRAPYSLPTKCRIGFRKMFHMARDKVLPRSFEGWVGVWEGFNANSEISISYFLEDIDPIFETFKNWSDRSQGCVGTRFFHNFRLLIMILRKMTLPKIIMEFVWILVNNLVYQKSRIVGFGGS